MPRTPIQRTLALLLALVGMGIHPACSEPIAYSDLEIKIAADAKSIQPDPAAVVLPDKATIYKVKGLLNDGKTPEKAQADLQTMLNGIVDGLRQVAAAKDADALVKLYDPSSSAYLLSKVVANPKLLEGFFKQSALIQWAKWRFAVQSGDLLTLFADVQSGEGAAVLMPFFFLEKDGQYVPIYQTAPNLMMMNVLVADQQKALSVSRL